LAFKSKWSARAKLYALIVQAAESHALIQIKGKRNNAVVVSEGVWAASQEALYLLSVQQMRESIKADMATPVEDCSRLLKW